MKFEGTSKEIADFVLAIQSQPNGITFKIPKLKTNSPKNCSTDFIAGIEHYKKVKSECL